MLKIIFLISIPFISAFIGWLTNYLAIKMLFHPKKPVKLLFFTLQGVFPKRQHVLAERLGEVISREFISTKDIFNQLSSNQTLSDDFRKITEAYLQDFIKNRLFAENSIIGGFAKMLLTDDFIDSVKRSFFKDWDNIMDRIKTTISKRLDEDVSIQHLIQEKVNSFSSDKLEEILFSILKKEFRFIEIIGAIVGFVIGCLQLLLAWIYTMV
ncbi:hypothetical protein COTS27_01096 [Spirochaetota bacterium]|nr:hypothetical protein COTS27_01096 [Spirochaetota bacterium]